MRVAFDYHGTLDSNPYLLKIAKAFKDTEWKLYVLTAVKQEEYKERIRVVDEFLKNHHIYMTHELVTYNGDDRDAGIGKLNKMKELSIDLLFDNNPIVVGIVRRGGRDAVLV